MTNKRMLRRLIRSLILESVSTAKGISNIVAGQHRVVINRAGSGYQIEMFWKGDDYPAAKLTTTSTDNPQVRQVGAIYIDDPKADGWGPFLSDIAMELTTASGKWLAMDRGEASPSAQKLWQFYKDHRLGDDVTGLQLDDHQNFLTPEDDDNIDTRMAEDQLWVSRYGRFMNMARNDEERSNVRRNFYNRNALMWAFKKEEEVLPALRGMEGVLEE